MASSKGTPRRGADDVSSGRHAAANHPDLVDRRTCCAVPGVAGVARVLSHGDLGERRLERLSRRCRDARRRAALSAHRRAHRQQLSAALLLRDGLARPAVRRSALCRARGLDPLDARHRRGRGQRCSPIRRLARRRAARGLLVCRDARALLRVLRGHERAAALRPRGDVGRLCVVLEAPRGRARGRARRAGDGARGLHQAQLHHAAAGRLALAVARQLAARTCARR